MPSNTTFILIADSNFGLLRTLQGVYVPGFDYTPAPLPETRFNTIVVINQYDGFADPIKDLVNLLTDLNAVMGIAYVHAFAQNTDLSTVPAGNITTTQNGKTTIYHVPTKQLPLTMPLRQLGVPDAIVDGIDAQLRPIIDEGYVDPAPRHSIPGPRTRAVKPTPNPQSTAAMSRQSPRVTTPHAAQSRSAKSPVAWLSVSARHDPDRERQLPLGQPCGAGGGAGVRIGRPVVVDHERSAGH